MYSFAENFKEDTGDRTRMCYYSRQWAFDTQGEWHQSTKAVATAHRRDRYDVEAGVLNKAYYIKHIGFFNTDFYLTKKLARKGDETHPDIDFSQLP